MNGVVQVGSEVEQTSTKDPTDKALPEETVKGTPKERKHLGFRAHPPFVEVHPPGLFKATMIHIHDTTDSSDTASSRLQYLTTSSEDSSEDESAPWPGRGPPGVIKVPDRSIRDIAREHIQRNACVEQLNTSELQRFNYNGVLDIIKDYENDPKERFAKTRKLPLEKTHKLSMEDTHKLSDDTSDYDTPPPLPPKIIYVQATDATSSSEIDNNEACHDKSKSATIPNQVGQKQHSTKQSGNTKKPEIDTATDTNDSGNDSPQDRSNNSEDISVNSSIDAELDRWLAEQKGQKPPLPPRINNSSIKDNTQRRKTQIPQEKSDKRLEQSIESSMPSAIEEIIDTPDSPGNYETIDNWLNQQKSPSTDTTKEQKDTSDKSNMKLDSTKHFNSCCDANLEKWLDEQKSKKPKENSKQPKVNIKLRKNISQKDPSDHENKLSRNLTWSLGATSSTPVPSSIIVSPRAYVKDTTSMTLCDIIECLQNANSLKPVYIKMHVRAEYTPDDDWTAKDEIKVESETIVNALYKQGEWAFVRTEDERGGFVPYKNLEPVNYKPIKVTDFCQQFPADGLESVIETTEDDSAFLPYGKHQNDTIPAVQGTQITQTINHQNTSTELEEDIYVEMNSPITTSHARSRSLPETLSSPTLSPRTKPLSSMKPCGCTDHHNCKASNIRTQHDPNGVSETVLKRIDKKCEINKILRVRSRSKNSSKRPSCDRKLYTDSSAQSIDPLENNSATGKSSSNKHNQQDMTRAIHQRRCSEDSLLSPIAAAQIYLHDSDDSEVFNTTNAKINAEQMKEDINTVKNTNQKSSANLERLRNLKSQLAGMNANDIADDLVQESIDMLENHLQNQLHKKTSVDPRSLPVEFDQGSTDSKEFTGEMLVGGDCTFIEHSIQSEKTTLGPSRNLLSPELFSEDMEISQQASSGHGTLSSYIDEGMAQGMEPQSSRSRMKSQDSLERCKSWLDELYSKSHDHNQRRTSAPSIHLKTIKRPKKPKTKDPFGLVDDLSPIVARPEIRTFDTRTLETRSSDGGTLYQNTKYRDILFNEEEEPIYEEYSLKNSKGNPPQKTMSDAIRGYASSTNTMETVIYNKSKCPKISKQPHSELERSRSKSELKLANIMDRNRNDDQYIQLSNAMKVSTEPKTHPNEQTDTTEKLMVLFDFEAKQENDLTVRKKEVVKLLENDDPHWVLVENGNGQQGYIPESYTTNLIKLHLDPKAKTTYF
ncbi:unnamed protein product [Owenia fusiformis]|nr:unnamed protein product [Owenia fusiformis]